jgi:hypothetical protein
MCKLIRNSIDGQFVERAKRFDNRNPVGGTLVSQVCEVSKSASDRAMAAAHGIVNLLLFVDLIYGGKSPMKGVCIRHT